MNSVVTTAPTSGNMEPTALRGIRLFLFQGPSNRGRGDSATAEYAVGGRGRSTYLDPVTVLDEQPMSEEDHLAAAYRDSAQGDLELARRNRSAGLRGLRRAEEA